MKKRPLQRMQFTVTGKSFDGLNARTLRLQHGHKAAVHQFAVHAHRAGPAFAFAAALLRSGQAQVFAQHVEETLHRWHMQLARLAVDNEFDC